MNITRQEKVIVTLELDETEARALRDVLHFLEMKSDLREGMQVHLGRSPADANNIAMTVMQIAEGLKERV